MPNKPVLGLPGAKAPTSTGPSPIDAIKMKAISEERESLLRKVQEFPLREILVADLTVRSPFKDEYDIEPEIVSEISASMKAHGFYQAQAVIVWKGILIDGHQRRAAAIEAGLKAVWAFFLADSFFENDTQALDFIRHIQNTRRVLDDSKLILIAERKLLEVDKLGYVNKVSYLKEILHRSQGQVSKILAILNNDDKSLVSNVKDGLMTIYAAHKEIQQRIKSEAHPSLPPQETSSPNRESEQNQRQQDKPSQNTTQTPPPGTPGTAPISPSDHASPKPVLSCITFLNEKKEDPTFPLLMDFVHRLHEDKQISEPLFARLTNL